MLRGPICSDGRRLLDVQRRNLLCDTRIIELLQLCARLKFRCWIERLFRLFCWHLPGCDGRIELLELLRGDNVCARGKRLLELHRWDLPGIHRRLQLHSVCSRDGLEHDWGVGFKHLRAMLGWVVLFNFDILRMHCVRCREFRA